MMTTSDAVSEEQPPPPILPTVTKAGQDDAVTSRGFEVAADEWRVVAERASQLGASPRAVLVGAFAEVLRTWSASPDFTLELCLPDDAVLPRVVVARRDDGSFGGRVARLEAQVASEAPTLPALTSLPVLVTERRETALAATGPTGTASLELQYRHGPQGLNIRCDARVAAFAPGLTDTLFDAMVRLLHRLATEPSTWDLTRIDLVPETDVSLVAGVNATAAPVPDILLQELLAARAAEQPDAEAVVDGRRRLRYGELAAYANRIGRCLRDTGAGPGTVVGIVMEKGWEQYAAVYGVLTAGAAYLPIDAASPSERMVRLLASGGVTSVLTQSWLASQIDWPASVKVHRVDQDFERGDATSLPAVQRHTDLAYVLFTSGSTGEPKGVMVDHRGVVNLVSDVNHRFAIGPEDRAFAVSALHFDASIYDVFGVVAAGGTAVLPEPFLRAQPDLWTDRIAAERVTLLNSVPALVELIVGQAEVRCDRPLGRVRLAVISGDWIPLTLPDRLRAQADVQVVGSGGPTETICWSVFSPIGRVDPSWASIPYGKPITNQRYYIVDDELRPRPVWAKGQMAVASEIGLAHGYFADEERTAARFVRLPGTGERAYLTGDLGRFLPDGNIEILGREDFQVKLNGYRVELGEIEAALRDQPGVEAAVVVAPEIGRGGRRLVAFVVGTPAVEGDELPGCLEEVLPRYMVPSIVHVLPAFPMTRNGKIDRLALMERASGQGARPPAVDDATAADGTSDADPSALEQLLATSIANVLGLVGPIGRRENFFHLGGDSISGARLAQDLGELLDAPVPLRVVLENPVVADLAVALVLDPAHGDAASDAAEMFNALRAEAAAGLIDVDSLA